MAPIFRTYVPTQAGFGSEGEGEGAAMSEQRTPDHRVDSVAYDTSDNPYRGYSVRASYCEECHGNE
jgi:hypothetical protein